VENIRRAIERAKSQHGAGPSRTAAPHSDFTPSPLESDVAPDYRLEPPSHYGSDGRLNRVELSTTHLASHRIVSHFVLDPFCRPFDMLRTQVLQSMEVAGAKILAVTSPTAGCGKSVTAVNLALSIARQPENSVLLMDLDFQKPKVATYLGLGSGGGVLSVLEGRKRLAEAVIHAHIGTQELMVLPTASTSGSAEFMASRAMATLFEELKRDSGAQTVIVDLPPILTSDDVIAILPHVDCVLLVVAAGMTKVSEIEECNKHLRSSQLLRIVLNKVPQEATQYYSY